MSLTAHAESLSDDLKQLAQSAEIAAAADAVIASCRAIAVKAYIGRVRPGATCSMRVTASRALIVRGLWSFLALFP